MPGSRPSVKERVQVQPAQVDVPRSNEFTPEWVTGALSAYYPGCVVDQVTKDETDSGTTDRSRIHLTYSKGQGPSTLFVKAQGRFGHRMLLGSMKLITPEARLLGSGEPLPYEHPTVYAYGLDRARLNSVIVMEDVKLRDAR